MRFTGDGIRGLEAGAEEADSGGTVLVVVGLKQFALQSVGFLEKLTERFFYFLCSFVLINQAPQQSFTHLTIPHVKIGQNPRRKNKGHRTTKSLPYSRESHIYTCLPNFGNAFKNWHLFSIHCSSRKH